MAALDFPAGPALGDTYSTATGTWRWNGTFWAKNAFGHGGGTATFLPTAGSNSITVNYTVGAVAVYLNGNRLTSGDYTATDGTSITFPITFVAGDVVEVVRMDVISTLDALQKQQNGADILDKAVFRTNIGQRWKLLEDIVVSGANASAVNLNLQSFRSLRLAFELYLPASVPSTSLCLRTSTDGVTYASGGTDYRVGFDYALGATAAASVGDLNVGQFTPTWQASQSTEIVVHGEVRMFSGASGKRFTYSAVTHGINSDVFVMQVGGRRSVAGQQSHVRLLLADGSANIGIGSRFILEGA